MSAKACYRCKETKPLSEFHKDRTRPDGHTSACKPCHVARTREWRDANRERYRESERGRPNVGRTRGTPTQRAAQQKVAKAVAAGKLLRPSECPRCGCDDSESPIQAHHEDYSAPLDVTWLCARCHAKEHRGGQLVGVGYHPEPNPRLDTARLRVKKS